MGWRVTKRALATEMQLQQQQVWQTTRKATTKAARAMAMTTKRAMATDGDNTGFTILLLKKVEYPVVARR